MATLLIGAAINIAVSLAINALFPPPDINQEGPRLSELGFTSSAYGKFVNIIFGTDRVDGNIIDVQDPVIEEVVSTETQSGGKGGGSDVTTTTYSYFFTGRIGFAIEGGADVIQLYGDGKLIYDATGTTQLLRGGVTMRFDPGGRTQIQDSEEISRAGRTAADQPAYRHLTSIKLDRLPLADFGNRIPNFTAVVAMASQSNIPHLGMTEPTGLDVPGSLAGGDVSYMSLDPTRNLFYSLKTGSAGTWSADATTLNFRKKVGSGGFSEPYAGLDGFVYTQTGASNAGPLQKRDADTGQVVTQIGTSGLGLLDSLGSPPTYANIGSWYQLNTTIPGVGIFSTVFHLNTAFPAGGPPNGSVTDADQMEAYHIISTADGLINDGGPLTGRGIPDHDRGRFFIFQDDDATGEYRLVEYIPQFVVGVGGATQTSVVTRLVKQFTRGSIAGGDDFEGTGNPSGWAVNRVTGDLMLSNGSSIVLYNPDADQILAQRIGASGFEGQNNYYSSSIFAFMKGSSTPSASSLTIIDTRTLETIRFETDLNNLIGWQGADSVIHEQSQVWDDRVQAIIFSRIDVGSDATNPNRILKVFVNRVDGLGVGLDFIADKLSSSYNNIEMAGLASADYDVTTLAGDSVEGYTINNQSTIKSALKPLRDRFFFDVIQSDWKIKFPKRGGAPVATVPEEFVGELKRGGDQTTKPPIVEIRTQDIELPMRLNVRYKNRDAAYDVDIEHDKRQRLPSPTMSSKDEKTLNIPIVGTPATMKPVAQNWLWTMWNERSQFKTIIPWEYLVADPGDIINVGAFGETLRLRLGEQDIGSGLAMDIVGVAEQTFTFASTIPAGSGLGRPTNNVPSSLPTRLVLIDAPLLSLIDLLVTPISNAYAACLGFEPTWPGATVMKSLDDVSYVQTTTTNTQAALAKVSIAPPAEVFSNGNPRNRILEITDGGTMVIVPINRDTAWQSATELAMLNGANHFLVMYPTGEVQVVAYVDAVASTTDNSITLNRLMLGRLGTEDISAIAMPIGSEIILLSDDTGQLEEAAIARQRLALAELNTATLFKAVTVGTLLEDAEPKAFTYTGRDIKPYFPAYINAEGDGGGGLDVTWERRTRGPHAGEWLDGTGTVPLNETIEQYEVTLSNLGGDFVTKIVNDATSVNFTPADIALGGSPGGIPPTPWPATQTVSGDFEGGTLNTTDRPLTEGGWVNINSPTGWLWRNTAFGFGPPTDGRISPASTEFMTHENNTSDSQRTVRNTIDLVADLGMAAADIPISTVRANIWAMQPDDADSFDFWLHVMNSSGGILATVSLSSVNVNPAESGVALGEWISVGSIYDAAGDPWPQRNLSLDLSFPGAAKVAFDLGINKGGTTFNTGRIAADHLEIEILTPPPDITVKVVQVSETGLKSPIAQRQVT